MKIIRTSTVPESLNTFCKGLLKELQDTKGYEVVAVSSPGKALDEIKGREGVKTIAVPMERHISPIRDLRSLWRLIRIFSKERPNMVHSITPKAGLLSMIAAWVCRVPIRLHTFTGLVFPTATGLTQKILILTDRITCACATHISPEGEGVKNDLINYAITRKPLEVLGYGNIRGIDLSHFDPEKFEKKSSGESISTEKTDKEVNNEGDSEVETTEDNSFNFIFIGRLVRDKGINELVKAFSKLHVEFPKTTLTLVGPEERELDPLSPETLAEIESNEAINAVGLQDDVRPWLADADALVFPSYREGFPNVVIEAGAMGLPSIVTDINGSREIIIEGENGVIVPSRDAEALYEAMRRFVTQPERVAEMARKARPLVASRYEQGFVRQALMDYYDKLEREEPRVH